MAEATLNDVIARLRADNEKQLREQGDTTKAIEGLSGTIRGLLDYLELQGLRQKEADAEARKKTGAAAAKAEGVNLGFDSFNSFSVVGLFGRFITGFGAFATGLVLAIKGLGPALANVRLFVKTITRLFVPYASYIANVSKAFGGNLGTFILKQISSLDNFFARRYTFNEAAQRFQRLGRFGGTGFVAAREVSRYQKILIGIQNLFNNIRNSFNTSMKRLQSLNRFTVINFVSEKITSLYQKTLTGVQGLFTRIGNAFKLLRFPSSVIGNIGKSYANLVRSLGGGARGAVVSVANSPVIRGIFRFLRPVAAILSIFDGFRNAATEMEDREDTLDKLIGGGLGGFISGTLGSFFGEFANLLIDLPLWLIKQIVPAQWLNEDGTFKRSSEGGNWFTSLLDAIDTVDFNTMIRELIQAPFDAVGGALAFVRNLFGATGTTEEGQAAAREAWNTWWSNWTSARGIVSNVGGILGFLANVAFHPLNVILNQIERAFTGDITAGVDETFTQKITRYVTQLGEFLIGLIPSIDDLKATIAAALGPDVANMFGLGAYLPFTNQAEVEDILSAQFERMQALADRITSINESIAATDDTEGFYANQLETAERDLRLVAAETEAVLARARNTQGIAPTVVNNYQQQFETMLNPMPSTVDPNDSIRR
jgi:methyl-accepting chemotaxis protein